MVNVARRSHFAAVVLALFFCGGSLSRAQHPAHADMFFCEDDPMVSIDGVKVDITVGIAPDGVAHIDGSVPVLVVVPDGVKARLLSVSHRYFNEQVDIVSSGEAASLAGALPPEESDLLQSALSAKHGRVVVAAEVPADGNFATRLRDSRSARQSSGRTNQVMVSTFAVPDKD